jgi:sensor histidine kinase YesM
MVRSLLVSSDKLTRSLKEELDFVKNYLELEKTRFTEVFSYAVSIEDHINQESVIPKMIIQLHVENALKHGLLPKKSGGFLDISVSSEGEYLLITITDNGIGRNLASKNISQSTGRGMKILAQFFETYNKHNKNQLKQEIVDLYDGERNPAGTMVKVFVPVEFNELIF